MRENRAQIFYIILHNSYLCAIVSYILYMYMYNYYCVDDHFFKSGSAKTGLTVLVAPPMVLWFSICSVICIICIYILYIHIYNTYLKYIYMYRLHNHTIKVLCSLSQMREVPDYLCGKISFELMRDPIITPSGIT